VLAFLHDGAAQQHGIPDPAHTRDCAGVERAASMIEASQTTAPSTFRTEPRPALKPLWDEVQAVLAANRVDRATGVRTNHPSLLTGLVFDEAGQRLTLLRKSL
jgi:hypothetical protein